MDKVTKYLMIPLTWELMDSTVGELMEIENRPVVARGWGRRRGELFTGCRVPVLQDGGAVSWGSIVQQCVSDSQYCAWKFLGRWVCVMWGVLPQWKISRNCSKGGWCHERNTDHTGWRVSPKEGAWDPTWEVKEGFPEEEIIRAKCDWLVKVHHAWRWEGKGPRQTPTQRGPWEELQRAGAKPVSGATLWQNNWAGEEASTDHVH